MPLMESKRGWDELSAVKNNRVFIADGNHYFNRPGPRVLESLQIMCEILHPEQFQFGFEGKGWQRYTGK
jgi:iron complex transport system substrate-binding protein